VRDVCRHILPSCPTINVDLKRADAGFDDCQHPWGSLIFCLIHRLAIGAEDDHTQALLPKALGELQSLPSCILFGSERSC
jgi:hypothetical protein